MWQCNNCTESIQDQFDACWRCGCSRAGGLATEFLKDSHDESLGGDCGDKIASQFRCIKCGHDKSLVERITGRGAGLMVMLAKDFLALSCENCGFAEFYNLSIVENRTGMQNFLRQLFRP